MRRREAETFSFNCEGSITERRARLPLQVDQILRQTLIRSYSQAAHVPHEVAIGKYQLGRKNFRADLETLVQIRLIAIRDAEVSIAKEVFQFVGHSKDHRILRQSFGQHYRSTQIIIDERTAQIPESIRPFIYFNSMLRINPHQIAGEDAW